MVNRRDPSHTPKGISGRNYVKNLAEMHAIMDELSLHNQTLEGDVHNNRQCQQNSNPPEDMETANHSQTRYGGAYLGGIHTPYLSKFDGCSDTYEYVSFINIQKAIVRASESLKCNLLSGTFNSVTFDGIQVYLVLSSPAIQNW